MPERDEFERDAQQQRGAERQQDAEHKTVRPGHEGRGEVGAHHVERAVRQIDEVHDAEHQRQAGRQQKQQQPELQAVQRLFYEDEHEPKTLGLTKQRQHICAAAIFLLGG